MNFSEHSFAYPRKPEGHCARDSIYRIIEELLNEGYSIHNIPNGVIAERQAKYHNGYVDQLNTISSYKAQYKRKLQGKPERSGAQKTAESVPQVPMDLAKAIKASHYLFPILKKMMDEMDLDEDAVRSVVEATLEMIDDEDFRRI